MHAIFLLRKSQANPAWTFLFASAFSPHRFLLARCELGSTKFPLSALQGSRQKRRCSIWRVCAYDCFAMRPTMFRDDFLGKHAGDDQMIVN
jgi:hypothetical protein